MSSLLKTVRSKVSGDRARHEEEGFNLDLTYVVPRIIGTSLFCLFSLLLLLRCGLCVWCFSLVVEKKKKKLVAFESGS